MNSHSKNITFYLAVFSLVGIFTASSSPIPLLGIFRDRLSILSSNLAYTAVSYFVGCIVALLFFSRISNSIGRRNSSLIALSLGLLACIILIFTPSFSSLLSARFIQGLGCGIASSSIMSYIIDTVPKGKEQLASFFNICGPAIGFCIGCALSTLSVMVFNIDILFIYSVFSCVHIVILILVFTRCTETINTNYKKIYSTLIPKIEVPKESVKFVITCSFLFITTWSVGGFFQSFIIVVTEEALHLSSASSGIFFILYIVTQTLGGLIIKNFQPRKCFVIMVVLYMFFIAVFFSVASFGSVVLFSLCCMVLGFCTSAAGTACMTLTMEGSKIEQRAGILSTVYLCGYLGAAAPNYIIGTFFPDLDLDRVFVAYTMIIVCSGILSLISFRSALKAKYSS